MRLPPLTQLFQLLDDFPPFYVIAIARRKRTLAEIAAQSGINLRTVLRLSDTVSNDEVKAGTIRMLWKGCGLDQRLRSSLKRTVASMAKEGNPMPHLSDRDWQRFCKRAERATKMKEAKDAKDAHS